MTNKAAGFEIQPDRERMFGYGNYERTIDALTGAVTGRDYICGNRFTAVDVYLGSQVVWGMQFGTMPANPSVRGLCRARVEPPGLSMQRRQGYRQTALIAGDAGEPRRPDRTRAMNSVENVRKGPADRIRRAFHFRPSTGSVALAAEQAKQEHEHVDEVEIEVEGAHDDDLAHLVGARDIGVHALELLRVIGASGPRR